MPLIPVAPDAESEKREDEVYIKLGGMEVSGLVERTLPLAVLPFPHTF